MRKRYLSAIMLVFMLVLQLFAPMKNHVLAEGTLDPTDISLELDAFELRVKVPIGYEDGNPIYDYHPVGDDLKVIDFDIYDVLQLSFKYKLEENHGAAGKTVTFSVPKAFGFDRDITSGILRATLENDQTLNIGTFIFNHVDNTITMAFSDDPDLNLNDHIVHEGKFSIGLEFS